MYRKNGRRSQEARPPLLRQKSQTGHLDAWYVLVQAGCFDHWSLPKEAKSLGSLWIPKLVKIYDAFACWNVWYFGHSGSIEPKSEPHAEKPQAKGNELDWTSGLSRVRGLRTQELEQLQAPTPHALAPVLQWFHHRKSKNRTARHDKP